MAHTYGGKEGEGQRGRDVHVWSFKQMGPQSTNTTLVLPTHTYEEAVAWNQQACIARTGIAMTWNTCGCFCKNSLCSSLNLKCGEVVAVINSTLTTMPPCRTAATRRGRAIKEVGCGTDLPEDFCNFDVFPLK